MALVTQNPEAFEKFLQRVRGAVSLSSIDTQTAIKAESNKHASNSGSGGAPSAPGEPPGKNTGSLSRSIQVDDTKLQSDFRNRVGTNLKYGRIHEVGGVIRAKKGKGLPIPFPANRAEAMRVLRAAGGSLRDVKDLVAIKTKKGDTLLVRMVKGRKISKKQGGGTRENWVPLFILKKSVRIPARPYIRRGLAVALPSIKQRFRDIGLKVP